MVYVRTLYDIALDFVAKNAHYIENLKIFPSLMGENIYLRCVDLNVLQCPERRLKILHLFSEAYPDQLLSSLRVIDKLVFVNEYLRELIVMSKYLTGLDLGYCSLGSNHEMIEQIGSMPNLKSLCLSCNSLNNAAVRRMSLPLRMFNRGPSQLKELDLSRNYKLDDEMVPWLTHFKQLEYVNLAFTNLTVKGRSILENDCHLVRSRNALLHSMKIVTQGWAKGILEFWIKECEPSEEAARKERRAPFVGYRRYGFYGGNSQYKRIPQNPHFRRPGTKQEEPCERKFNKVTTSYVFMKLSNEIETNSQLTVPLNDQRSEIGENVS